jgi:hypothetical protein
MDNASVLKCAADKVAKHVADIAPDLCDTQSAMVTDLLEIIMKFPIVKINDNTKEEEQDTAAN